MHRYLKIEFSVLMKARLLIALTFISSFCFSQKIKQQFSSLNDIMHASITKDAAYAFSNNFYGGGIFIAKDKSNYVIDSGTVFPTSDANIVLVRKMNDAHNIQINWYGIKDSAQNFMPAFKKAAKYLSTIGGGTVLFDAGTYFADPFFTIDANNIIVKGAGMNKTFIKVSDKAGAGLMVNSNYRDAGWLLNADDMLTYKDDGLPAGRNYIDLKIKDDKNKLVPGTIIFINGGANYFDQNYGEFNIVDHITANGRVYLKHNLSRSYSQNLSSWAAALTADFKPPAEGSNGTIYFSGTQPRGGTAISIGNDLYKVVSSTNTSAVVTNVKNKGNNTSVIPAGTHIFKYRAIVLTPSVVYNVAVSDMTVTGKRKSLTVSNTFKTSFNNMRFNWLPQPASPGGVWLDGDDGRDFKMSNCEVNCIYYFSAQFARSFADIYIDHTKFNQAAIQFTEYNINANVRNCEFHLAFTNKPGETKQPAILLGNTCSNINFSNNLVDASNLDVIFYSGEIQGTKAIIASTGNIMSNTIKCNNIATVFSGAYSGNMNIANNNISGKANYLFNVHAYTPSIYQSLQNDKRAFNNCIITNNSFTGYIDGFGSSAGNVEYINNKIKRLGAANASNEYNAWGNVLYTHFTKDTSDVHFVFKNNTFENWNLLPNSLSHYWKLNEKKDISNNRFITGSKDSVISIRVE